MPIRFEREGNPWYPLPPDYDSLTAQGKRLARVNAVCLQETPQDLAEAWAFFRAYYLEQLPDGSFYDQKLPSPPMHYEMVHDLGKYSRNAIAAPRGFAKSTVIGTEVPLFLLLSRKFFSCLVLLAKDSMVERRFDKIMQQLEHNEYILEDFGSLRPKKGDGIWNRHMLRLTNGASLIGCSVDGKMRGERPRLIICDDPEFDPEGENLRESQEKLLRQFERWLFRVVLPMLKKGSTIFWIGTRVSERSFLTHVTSSDDPRFRFWNRRVYAADYTASVPLWPEMWTNDELRKREEEIGRAAFAAEYLNRPGTDEDRILQIHPQFCTYRVSGDTGGDPVESTETLTWEEPVVKEDGTTIPETRTAPFKEKVGRMFRFITVDPARTVKVTSDFSAIHVMGLDHLNVLWSLDLILARLKEDVLIRQVWETAIKWKARVVGVEAVSTQEQIVDRMQSDLGEMSMRHGWVPRLMPITHPYGVDKPARIAALAWRFNTYKVRLPVHRSTKWPYSELWHQVRDFTEQLELLKYDDAVDTLAMSQNIVRSRKPSMPDIPKPQTVRDRLLAGERTLEGTGIPLINALDLSTVTVGEIMDMQAKWFPDPEPTPIRGEVKNLNF